MTRSPYQKKCNEDNLVGAVAITSSSPPVNDGDFFIYGYFYLSLFLSSSMLLCSKKYSVNPIPTKQG